LGAGGPGAGQLQFGGEVSSRAPSTVAGKMGSGVQPSNDPTADFGRVAFQMLISKKDRGDLEAAKLSPINTGDSNFYKLVKGEDADWGSYFFYGGNQGF